MKKIMSIFTAFAVIALLFAGCPNPEGPPTGNPDNPDNPDTPVKATGVTITPSSTANLWVGEDLPDNFATSVLLTATVTPTNVTDNGVTWVSGTDGIVTLSAETGSSITVTAVAAGSTVITVTTVDGSNKSATYTVTVEDYDNYVEVTGVEIVDAEGDDVPALEFNKSGAAFSPVSVQLSLVYTPSDATPFKIEWASSDDAVATVSSSGLVTPVGAGSAVITVKIDNKDTVTDTVDVTVIDPTYIPIEDWELLLHTAVNDTYGSLDVATSTALGTVTDKRYTIKNNESTANFDGNNVSDNGIFSTYKNSTFVYLNKPFAWSGKEFGVSMRVKMTAAGTGTLGDGSAMNHGFHVGVFSDPKEFKAGVQELNYTGIRNTVTGQIGHYSSRQGATNAAPSGAAIPDANDSGIGRQVDSVAGKVEGFSDQEYIYKVYTETSGQYKLELWTPDGELMIASDTRGASANQISTYLSEGVNPVYLGLMVTYATVEISDITFWEGTDIWKDEDTEDADIRPVPLRSTTIGPQLAPTNEYDYNILSEVLDPFQLSVTTVPRTALRYAEVEWLKTADTIENADGTVAATPTSGATVVDGFVTIPKDNLPLNGTIKVDVKATLTGDDLDTTTHTGGNTKTFKIFVLESVPKVSNLVIGPDFGYTASVEAGDGAYTGETIGLKLAQYTPNAVLGNLSWRVTDSNGDSAVNLVTLIPASDGLSATLKATDAGVPDDTIVKVYIKSPNGASGDFESAAFEVTVKKWSDIKIYNFSDEVYSGLVNVPAGTYRQVGGILFGGNFNNAGGMLQDNPSDLTGGNPTFNDTYLSNVTFTKMINTNGSSMAGDGVSISNDRRVVVPLQGPAKVTLYGFTNATNPATGNAAAPRYVAFNTSRTDVPTLTAAIPESAKTDATTSPSNAPVIAAGTVVCANNMPNGSLNANARIDGFAVLLAKDDAAAKTAPAGFFTSNIATPHDVVIWAQNSVCYWAVVVDYNAGGTPPVPETVTITTAASTINAGATLAFAATVGPVGAPQDVTWEVFASDGTSSTTAASFAGNVLTADSGVSSDTEIVVKATSATVPTASGTKTLTVKAAGSVDPNLIWEWIAANDTELTTIASNATRNFTIGTETVPVTAISSSATAVTTGVKGYDLKNIRFVIGSSSSTATGSSATDTTHVPGVFDLTKKFKVTVDWYSPDGGTATLQMYINNNTSNSDRTKITGNSTSSRIYNLSSNAFTQGETGKAEVTVDYNGGTAANAKLDNAAWTIDANLEQFLEEGFISIRVDNNPATGYAVRITGVLIEYVD